MRRQRLTGASARRRSRRISLAAVLFLLAIAGALLAWWLLRGG
jgi:hypothetical protein